MTICRSALGAVACLPLLLPGCALGPLSPLAPLERSLVFQPTPFPPGREAADLGFEDVSFTSADGTRLHGWYAHHDRPRAVALFFHGNAGNMASRAESLLLLNRRHGLAVMMFDYRGYGRSEGKPNEQGVLDDARAARAWLASRTGLAERDIVLMGRSLGGGIAVDLAAQDGARGLVLASTFTSLPDVAFKHAPWLPAHLLMTQRLNSLAKIGDYRGPLLQSHGDADEIVPYELGQRLFEAAPGPKRFITIPGGRHNDPQPEEYRRALDEFLDALPPVSGAAPWRP